MIIRLHKKRTLLVTLFVFFLLQQAFLEYTSGVLNKAISYADEITECILILLIVLYFYYKKARLNKIEYRMIFCYIVFVLLGLISNVVTPMQSCFLALTDMLVCSRFIVFYLAVRILVQDTVDYEKLLLSLVKVCKLLAVVMAVLALHDIFFTPFFPQHDYRYFMYSLQLFFSHPTYMAVACMTCACILMAEMEFEKRPAKRREIVICIVIYFVLTCLTLRSKAIAVVACAILLYFMLIKWKVKSKVLLICGGAILAIIIGWDQLQYYYTANVAHIVRARLMLDSIQLANDYFPFGTGFSTFGSALAADNYSPLYTKLGYNSLYGGSRNDTRFLCDTFWPTVIAQTGWLGVIAFLGIVVCLVYIAFRAQKKSKYIFWALMTILVYELISSTSETAFFNPTSGLLMALFALLINICENKSQANDAIEGT